MRSVWRVVPTPDSRLYRLHMDSAGMEVDLRTVQKTGIVDQVRNEGLTWKIEAGIEKGEWIRETSSLR